MRKELKLPPFLVISSGSKTFGFVTRAKSIYEGLENKNSQLMLFVEEADGSEEIPINISCIILQHTIPQLSHLAIRARQANTTFICCEEIRSF